MPGWDTLHRRIDTALEARMATKAAYSEDEWQILQWAVTGTMSYVAWSDPGFWDSFKEASGAARYIATQRDSSPSELVRDLAGDFKIKKDKEVSVNPADFAGGVLERIAEATALVTAKDAEDVPAFRDFILGLAQVTAEATDGVVANESDAISKIRGALG